MQKSIVIAAIICFISTSSADAKQDSRGVNLLHEMTERFEGADPIVSMLEMKAFSKKWTILSFYKINKMIFVTKLRGSGSKSVYTNLYKSETCTYLNSVEGKLLEMPKITAYSRGQIFDIDTDNGQYQIYSNFPNYQAEHVKSMSVLISSPGDSPYAELISKIMTAVAACTPSSKAGFHHVGN